MTGTELLFAIGEIPETLVEEAESAQKAHRKPNGRKLLFLAAVLALMTTSVLAVRFGWHRKLTEYLSPTDVQMEALTGAADFPVAEAIQHGVTVRVCQTLTDAYGLYVLCEVTGPKGVDLQEVMIWRNVILEGSEDAVALATTRTTILEQERQKVTFLISKQTDKPMEGGELHLTLQDLCRYDAEAKGSPYVPVAEGTWELSWEFDFVDAGMTYPVEEMTVYLSPMTRCIRCPEANAEPMPPVLHFRDGSNLHCGEGTNRATVLHTEEETVCIYRFVPMVDLEEVEAVEVSGSYVSVVLAETRK